MADISKVTASDGTTYDIKDTTARNTIDNKMDKQDPIGTGSFSLNRKANTTVGNYSTAEGYNCTASGSYSHAEGRSNTASSFYSHAEGYWTNATNYSAHAEGEGGTASGRSSHVEGGTRQTGTTTYQALGNTASGDNSHAEGVGNIASSTNQHVFGKYNIEDDQNIYVEIVGNGAWLTTDVNPIRSNARTLDWLGNETIAGDLTFNGSTSLTSALSGKQATLVSGTNIKTINSTNILGSGNITTPDTKPTGLTADNNPSASAMVSSGNWNDLYKLPLTAGKLYLISVAAQFASNSNGCRGVGIRNNTYTPMGIIYQQTVQAANGAATNVVWTGFFTPQAEEEYYIIARQYNSSNTSINCTYRYRYVALT